MPSSTESPDVVRLPSAATEQPPGEQPLVEPAPSSTEPVQPASAAPVSSEIRVEVRRHPAPVRWRSRPAFDDPRATLVLVAAIVATCVAVYVATHSTVAAVATAVALALATASHWTNTVYETGREALRIESWRGVLRLRWSRIDRWYEDRRGVWLIAPRRPMPWDWLGGVYCPWPADREALRIALRYYLGHADENRSTGPP